MVYVGAQMVSAVPNPAIDAFIALVTPEVVFGQVLVRKTREGFLLTHVDDRDATAPAAVTLPLLREISEFTHGRQFRPLKAAPTLQRGWSFVARTESELNDALQCLYPGAVADWFAAQQPNPPVTSFREFTGRQTGMYRITTMLSDEQIGQLAHAGCHRLFCLKRRLWGAESLSTEPDTGKSLIPCLEPCAVLLEFARAAVRLEQHEKRAVLLAPEEIETCALALERAAQSPREDLREADFSAAENPRRARLLVEKLRTAGAKS